MRLARTAQDPGPGLGTAASVRKAQIDLLKGASRSESGLPQVRAQANLEVRCVN